MWSMELHIACVIMRWMWLGGRVNVDLVCTGIFATFCDHEVCVCIMLTLMVYETIYRVGSH